MKTTHYVILLILLTILGCRKDSESESTTTSETPGPVVVGYQPDVERINTVIEGFVHDHLDQPLDNVNVTFGSNSVTTDDFGYFKLSSASLNKFGEVVTIEHPGYFDINQRVYPHENSSNWVKFKLSQKIYDQFNSNSGGNVPIPGGGFIQIAPNSLVTLADTIYNGTVQMAVNYIDVNQHDEIHRGAGNHFGIDRYLNEVILNSYGMLAIDVISANGDPLKTMQVDSMKPILTLPISPANINNAPSTIKLWNFYEPYSAWVEGEVANQIGNNYRAKLTYFNYVNFGESYPASYFDAQVLDFGNVPHTNSIVTVQLSDSIVMGYDIVDDQGYVNGYYPENRIFDLAIRDLCAQKDQVSFVPTSGPQNFLPPVLFLIGHTKIVANVTCNGAAVNSFYVNLNSGNTNNYYRGFSNDSVTIPACLGNPNATVTILDPTSQASQTIPINPGLINNLGNIDLCNTGPTDYIQFDYDTLFYFWPSPIVDTAGGITKIYLSPSGCFEFYGNTAGNYGGPQSNSFIYEPPGFVIMGSMDTLNVTTYSNTSIIGSFAGYVMDTIQNNQLFVKGDFNIEL